MKIKTKLLTMISLMALTAVMLVVGVWALKTVNFTIDGNLSYIAPGIEATISKGTVTNAVWVNASDASTKMPLTQITRTDTEETLATKFSYWQGVNLNFNEAGDEIKITFSITNNSSSKAIDISVSTSYTSADNCTISVDTTSTRIDAGKSHTFTLTMAVTDKTANATMTNFAVVFNMQLAEPVQPVDPEDYPYLVFEETDSTNKYCSVSINRSVTCPEEIVVPSHVDIGGITYAVTSIPGGYDTGLGFTGASMTSIVLPDTLKSIAGYAFQYCSSLTKLYVGSGIEHVSRVSFSGTNISYNTYEGGNYLGSKTNLYYVLVSQNSTTITSFKIHDDCRVIISEMTGAGYGVFENCTSLTNIVLPNKLKTIGDSAFRGCTGLTTITIPDSVTSIGDRAFNGCTVLTSITIPDSVTSIGYSTFEGCIGLTSITIPDKVTSIGTSAFSNCTSLATVEVKATTVPTGGVMMFDNCPLTTGILVPRASVEAYKSATYWSNYSSKIQAGNF